jgi:DNA-directed RNA polymerase subunit RPC12/RpoP
MFKKGDAPGKGDYRCTRCGKIIHLENDTDTLPRCPKCFNTKFEKAEVQAV